MIHEILLSLWNNFENLTDLSETINFFELQEYLHPGDIALLRRIIGNIADYNTIIGFIKNVESQSLNNDNNESQKLDKEFLPKGFYVKSFCNGIDLVLQDYKKEIIKLESLYLQNPDLQLPFLLSSLEKYSILFEELKLIVEMVQRDNLHGCLLLERLHKKYGCGMNDIQIAADKIIQTINIVFYRDLCNWIIYGDLIDIYNEFFICDGKCPDEDFLYPEQISESALTSSGIELFKKSRIRRPPIVKKFYINWNLVPFFISQDIAERILFMGRIVWIIRNDPKKVANETDHLVYKSDVWNGEDVECYQQIQMLENQTYNDEVFQKIIEKCRIKLTKYLWSIMLDEGNLIEHLRLIREYYALGRGELFQQFLTCAQKYINDASDHVIQNLNFIFMESARNIYGENDKSYMRFELAVTKDLSDSNCWSQLQFNFEINWPLHIVFHPKAMELYNKLFCYLLRLKKTQINLHKLWQLHMSGKQKIDRRVWTLRQNLIFLVNNLQYYLQVDVIETQFSLLMKQVQNANEFEDIIKVHHEFISNLLAKSFILTSDDANTYKNKHRLYQMPAVHFDVPSKIYNVIIHLLDICDQFCLIASTWDVELSEPELIELEKFQKRTDTVVESLLFILYRLHEKVKGEHLLQLLYQLDFNRYFSKNKPNFNLTVGM